MEERIQSHHIVLALKGSAGHKPGPVALWSFNPLIKHYISLVVTEGHSRAISISGTFELTIVESKKSDKTIVLTPKNQFWHVNFPLDLVASFINFQKTSELADNDASSSSFQPIIVSSFVLFPGFLSPFSIPMTLIDPIWDYSYRIFYAFVLPAFLVICNCCQTINFIGLWFIE